MSQGVDGFLSDSMDPGNVSMASILASLLDALPVNPDVRPWVGNIGLELC